MKKRNLVLVFVLIATLLASQATAFADVHESVSPRYNKVSGVSDCINFYNGVLYFSVDVLVDNRDTLDYVIINAELKTMAGESIATYNKRLAYSAGQFSYERSHVPDHNGFYFLEYTVKCYKNGKLVDEISKYTKREYVEIN